MGGYKDSQTACVRRAWAVRRPGTGAGVGEAWQQGHCSSATHRCQHSAPAPLLLQVQG